MLAQLEWARLLVDIMSQSELTITIYVGDIVGYIIGDIVRNGDLPE